MSYRNAIFLLMVCAAARAQDSAKFAWTNGYEPGNFQVFVMDFRSRAFVQLTRGEQASENPVWAATGRHLAYAVRHRGISQIWSMLADGTNQKQLTTAGSNTQPVWARIPAE